MKMSNIKFERVNWFMNLLDTGIFSSEHILLEIIRYLSSDKAEEFANEFCRLHDVDFNHIKEGVSN